MVNMVFGLRAGTETLILKEDMKYREFSIENGFPS